MSEAERVYTPPQDGGAAVPAEMAQYLDGTDLLAKTQALRLSTVDSSGWPHTALLSAGDMIVLPPGRIRFVIFAESTTTVNLVRDGRVTLTMALDGGICELRMRARRLASSSADVLLAVFEAEVESARKHVAPYADVTSDITFSLHDPQAVLARWERQIAAMRAAA